MAHASPRARGPERGVAVGGAAGAAVTVLIWAAGLAGVDMPAEVAAALVTLAGFAAGWWLTPRAPGCQGEKGA